MSNCVALINGYEVKDRVARNAIEEINTSLTNISNDISGINNDIEDIQNRVETLENSDTGESGTSTLGKKAEFKLTGEFASSTTLTFAKNLSDYDLSSDDIVNVIVTPVFEAGYLPASASIEGLNNQAFISGETLYIYLTKSNATSVTLTINVCII